MIHGINIYDEKVIVFRDEFLVFHLFPFINRAQDWLPFLGPLGQANLCFLIGVRRISGKIYLFLEQNSSWNRGSNVNGCYPLSKMTQALELLRREPSLM